MVLHVLPATAPSLLYEGRCSLTMFSMSCSTHDEHPGSDVGWLEDLKKSVSYRSSQARLKLYWMRTSKLTVLMVG